MDDHHTDHTDQTDDDPHHSYLIDTPRGAPRLPLKRALPEWRLDRVLCGHTGWVRAVTAAPDNHWLATGATDRLIKLWDLATGQLLLSLTGHVAAVRGLSASPRHPYLLSCGDDRQVKSWDLTTNTVTRHYHGHLHAVTAVRVHPHLDLVVTASRDGTGKLWDMRNKRCIHTLCGHKDAVHDVAVGECDPQIVTGSADGTVRLWDICAGRTISTLTHHKKGVRAVSFSPFDYTMGSCGDTVKRWQLPSGRFLHNAHSDDHTTTANTRTVWNCMAINNDNVAAVGADDGRLAFLDWSSGSTVNTVRAPVQPGSLECEAGVLACCFDVTGSRLFTGNVDKTVKVYRECDDGVTTD